MASFEFDITRRGNEVFIAWQIPYLKHKVKFMVFKSEDGKQFKPLWTLPGNTNKIFYSLNDYKAISETIYYRLNAYKGSREVISMRVMVNSQTKYIQERFVDEEFFTEKLSNFKLVVRRT